MWPFKPKVDPKPVIALQKMTPRTVEPGDSTGGVMVIDAAGVPTSSISPYVSGAGRIMVTNGGAHPPELWAQATAQHIAPISPGLAGRRYTQALELQLAIAAALEPHHANVQSTEAGKLAADPAHLLTDVNPEPHLDEAMSAILGAAKGSEWEAHFGRADVQATIRLEVGAHFATSQHIERSWAVDRSPDHPYAQAWRDRHHPGV